MKLNRPSISDTDGQTTQKRTQDPVDAKATTTTMVPPVCYENVAVSPNPQDGTVSYTTSIH